MPVDIRSAASQDEEMQEVARRAQRIAANVASVILGKDEVIRACVVALLAGGHIIIEDYPGVGKTLLAKALARSVNCRFARVQFTPDLLPSDVTGVSVFNQKTGEFEFRPGPIFANIVLADEINRSSPKTQASLLECMEERQATIDNVTHPIAAPFMVIATQNPIEYEGTYPLPEAQLDRFMMRLGLGYPSVEAETAILHSQTAGDPFADLDPVLSAADVIAMQDVVSRVKVVPALRRYVVDVLSATRASRDVYLGASPRAGHRAGTRSQGPRPAQRAGLRGAAGPQGPLPASAQPPDHPLAPTPACTGSRRQRSSAGCWRRSPSRECSVARPTARGLGLLGIVVGTYVAARVVGTWELYLLSFAFLAALLVSWLMVLTTGRKLEAGRSVIPAHPTAGDDLVLSFRMKNGSVVPGCRSPWACGRRPEQR